MSRGRIPRSRMAPTMTEAEVAAAKAENAAAEARGFGTAWRVVCSAQRPDEDAGNYDQAKDHMLSQPWPWGKRGPWPHERLGAWAPVLDDDGKPVLCSVCGAPIERTPLPY